MLIAYIKYHPESLNRPIMQENKMSQSKINVEFIEEPTQTFSEREENKEPEQGIASADLKKRFFAVTISILPGTRRQSRTTLRLGMCLIPNRSTGLYAS